MKHRLTPALAALAVALFPMSALAQEPAHLDTGDTAWMLVSSAFVLFMTPGLALFYGGMVRRRNVLNTFMLVHFALAIITLQWVLVGYSLAFGPTHGGLIGGFDMVMLRGVGLDNSGKVLSEWEPALRELRLSAFPLSREHVAMYLDLIDQHQRHG